METFTTHTGDIITGQHLNGAVKAVADDMRTNAHAIRKEDAYASHVTEAQKEQYLAEQLDAADCVENGTMRPGFWLWQRINTKLTGECVAFLPKARVQ